MLKPMNHIFITLILKKGGSTMLDDFHLISCIGTLYKLITKLIADQLAFTLLQDIGNHGVKPTL